MDFLSKRLTESVPKLIRVDDGQSGNNSVSDSHSYEWTMQGVVRRIEQWS